MDLSILFSQEVSAEYYKKAVTPIFEQIRVIQFIPEFPTPMFQFPPEYTVVAHMPFFVSFAKPLRDKIPSDSLRYIQSILPFLQKANVSYIVAHVGSLESKNFTDAANNVLSFCRVLQPWLKDITFCLENDAGSKKGTRMGSLELVIRVLEELRSESFGLCLDTEHAYADGTDLSQDNIYNKVVKHMKVLHLNSVPDYVTFGEHLDRHSETPFVASKWKNVLIRYGKRAIQTGVPIVLERDLELVSLDLKWIEENCL